MTQEHMQLGETFQATKIPAGGPGPVRPRHAWIGWGLLIALVAAVAAGLASGGLPNGWQERPGFQESLRHKVSGILTLDVVRDGLVVATYGPFKNTIVNEGETALRDCFIATSCTDTQNFKYHGIGTSSQAIAETDGGCITELTTQYNPDSTRATGSQTNNGANIYRTVGTNTVDASATIEEFCLMATSTGAATMWTRILTGTITLAANDGLQTTYDLTIE